VAVAKAAFVEAAADQISERGDRVSNARIAVLTGLSRADVGRIRARHDHVPTRFAEQRTERVMHGWFTDQRYLDSLGNPRALTMVGQHSFEELVREYSGDMPRMAVLEELRAGGMADVNELGRVRALRRHHLMAPGRAHLDLAELAAEADIFLRSATISPASGSSAFRRVAVRFPYGMSLAIRRNITLRTERFLEAMADYLHAASSDIRGEERLRGHSGVVWHVMIAQCEIENEK
jgi:hypothetical protein